MMWTSEKWRDYQLIDCGGGQRLERWGQQVLVRPDPQAIWEKAGSRLREEGILRGILSSYWPLVFCVYFLISFYLGIWAISWLIYWPIAPAVQKALYGRLHQLEKRRKEGERK